MMPNTSHKSLLIICLLLHLFFLIECQKPLAPALYVFGSSIVDSGNNNFLKTSAKANYSPYGIDFPSGSTGRFTNGKTMADFIAAYLGLPFAPPYLGLSDVDKNRITTGVNYASGSAGILPETGTTLGDNLGFDEQIKFFEETVTQHLPKVFRDPSELSHYLSNSIFFIAIGSNDYLTNYLQPQNYNSSKKYNPIQFSQFLLENLAQRLKKLYELGGRKFVVIDINPLGCLPAVVNRANPKPITPCVEPVNQLVRIFNMGLPIKLLQLQRSLPNSIFVRGDVFGIIYDMILKPFKHGLTTTGTPCCKIGTSTACLPNQPPCQDRSKYLYWDAVHLTQQVHFNIANGCFYGSSVCSPINIQQLLRKAEFAVGN